MHVGQYLIRILTF